MSVRYTYVYGIKTYALAAAELDDLLAEGEVSECEAPMIESYTVNRDGREVTRYKITLGED